MKYARLEKAITKLLAILEVYGNEEIDYQINQLKLARQILNFEEDNVDRARRIEEIIDTVYPPQGGLTDFYVWDEDEAKRVAINKPISDLSDELWGLVKGTQL